MPWKTRPNESFGVTLPHENKIVVEKRNRVPWRYVLREVVSHALRQDRFWVA